MATCRISRCLLFVAVSAAAYGTQPPTAPVARQAPTTVRIHQSTLVDPYAWLDSETDHEAIAYLEAENRYAAAVMKGTESLQRKLFREMVSRIDETAPQPPQLTGKDVYLLRYAPGKQYLLLCRRRGGPKAPEEVLFDLNAMAGEGKKPNLGVWRLSPDCRYLAYSVDWEGNESFTIFVQPLDDRRKPVERIAGAGRWLEWAADSRTLFYLTPVFGEPPHQLLRRRMGQPDAVPEVVVSETSRRHRLALLKTKTGDYLVLLTYGPEWEVRFLPADNPSGEFRLIEPRRAGSRYQVAQQGDWFYLLVSDSGPNPRVVRAAAHAPGKSAWEEILPAQPGRDIADLDVVAGKLIVSEREDGLGKIRIHDLTTHAETVVPFPEPLAQVRLASALEREFQIRRTPQARSAHLFYESFVRPRTLFEYDLERGSLHTVWRSSVPNFRPEKYESRRVFASGRDGTRIPISLVYRKPLTQDGRRPLLLYAYGAMGYSAEPWFEAERLSLLDRGIVFGVAHVRGGGELGEAWHRAAMGTNKLVTFTDFIACAEHLIEARFTSSGKLAITGASLGGMLMTGVANMRPDLFQAVVAKVPAVEVFYRRAGSPKLSVLPEFGDPEREVEFNAMLAYAPYYNVKAQAYPHMLVTASRNDPRVSFSEPAKFTAKLRSSNTGDRTVLLRVDMQGGGHMGSAGRLDHLRETAFEYAFLLRALNIDK